MKEIKEILGYEGLYGITKDGVLYSLKRNKERKFWYNPTVGRYVVMLSKNNKRKVYLKAKLLALAWIPNLNNHNEVNHIDGNRLNDSIENIEWCSAEHNNKHALDLGLIIQKPVNQYDKSNNLVNSFNSVIEASRQTYIDRGNLTKACKGIYKSAGGYKWEYA